MLLEGVGKGIPLGNEGGMRGAKNGDLLESAVGGECGTVDKSDDEVVEGTARWCRQRKTSLRLAQQAEGAGTAKPARFPRSCPPAG